MRHINEAIAPNNPLYDPSPDHTATEQTILGRALYALMHAEHNQHLREMEMYDGNHAVLEGWSGAMIAVRRDELEREHLARMKEIDRLRRRYVISPIDLLSHWYHEEKAVSA